MTWREATDTDAGSASMYGAPDVKKISQMFNGTDVSDTVSINAAVVWTYADGALRAVSVRDANGNEVVIFGVTASAVNEVTITNAATAGSPTIAASGGDTNIDLTLAGKGTGQAKIVDLKLTNLNDTSGNEIIKTSATASAVNEITIANAATGGNPTISATGGDSNVGIKLSPKGTGVIYGNREFWDYPLTDETTLPTTGVKYVAHVPYNFTVTDVQVGLTTAGTGASLFTVDVLYEDTAPNTDTFTTIFSTKPTVDASEFTSTTAATPMALSVTSFSKGRRFQLKIHQLDSNSLARGVKVTIVGYATAV